MEFIVSAQVRREVPALSGCPS